MKFHELITKSAKSPKRVGRGISAGQGKTAGRGTKGQKSRTGYSRRPGFEGGQNPLSQRFPKLRGFRSHHGKLDVVYTEQIANLGATVTNEKLAEAGLVTSQYTKVKLLSRGEYGKKQTIKLQTASKTALEAIAKAGGAFEATAQIGRPKTSTKEAKADKKAAAKK